MSEQEENIMNDSNEIVEDKKPKWVLILMVMI